MRLLNSAQDEKRNDEGDLDEQELAVGRAPEAAPRSHLEEPAHDSCDEQERDGDHGERREPRHHSTGEFPAITAREEEREEDERESAGPGGGRENVHPVAHDPERAFDTRMTRERRRESQRRAERNRVPGESTPLTLSPQRERREQRERQRQPGSNEPDPAEPRIDHVSEEGRPESRAETEAARLRPLEADACDRDDREQRARPRTARARAGGRPTRAPPRSTQARTIAPPAQSRMSARFRNRITPNTRSTSFDPACPASTCSTTPAPPALGCPTEKTNASVYRVRVSGDDTPGDRVRAARKPRTHADGDLVRLGLRGHAVVDPIEPAVVDADGAESALDRLVEGEHDLLRGTREHGAVRRRRRDERCVGERRGSHDERQCRRRDQRGAHPSCHPNRPGQCTPPTRSTGDANCAAAGSAEGDGGPARPVPEREHGNTRNEQAGRGPNEPVTGDSPTQRAREQASERARQRPKAAGRGGTRRTRPAAAVAAPRRMSAGDMHPRETHRRGTAARSAPARRRSRAPAPRTSERRVERMRCRARGGDGGARRERNQDEHAADREGRRRIHQVRVTGLRQLVGSLGSVRSDQPVRELVCQL